MIRTEILVEDIWLIREGDRVVVLAKVAGKYRRLISEYYDAPFSHCIHANGIKNAPVDTVYVGAAPVELCQKCGGTKTACICKPSSVEAVE